MSYNSNEYMKFEIRMQKSKGGVEVYVRLGQFHQANCHRVLGERNPGAEGFENFDTLIENLREKKKKPEGIKTGNACRLASTERLNTTKILILP